MGEESYVWVWFVASSSCETVLGSQPRPQWSRLGLTASSKRTLELQQRQRVLRGWESLTSSYPSNPETRGIKQKDGDIVMEFGMDGEPKSQVYHGSEFQDGRRAFSAGVVPVH